jgi:hypothetical protein
MYELYDMSSYIYNMDDTYLMMDRTGDMTGTHAPVRNKNKHRGPWM